MTSRMVLNLHGFEAKRRHDGAHPRPVLHPPRRPSENASGFANEGSILNHDEGATQFTTQVSRHSTWVARAAEDLETNWTQTSRDSEAPSSSNSCSSVANTKTSVPSVYSPHYKQDISELRLEEGYMDDARHTNEICELRVLGDTSIQTQTSGVIQSSS